MLYLLLTGLYCNGNDLNTLQHVGAWRSLVAYLNGVQRAGGSNPLAPTIKNQGVSQGLVYPFYFAQMRAGISKKLLFGVYSEQRIYEDIFLA